MSLSTTFSPSCRYLPPTNHLEKQFSQLVTGVIWLVRNGESYVDVSIKTECPDEQSTGMMVVFCFVLFWEGGPGHWMSLYLELCHFCRYIAVLCRCAVCALSIGARSSWKSCHSGSWWKNWRFRVNRTAVVSVPFSFCHLHFFWPFVCSSKLFP